jgi:PAS domain S-box-containing protein
MLSELATNAVIHGESGFEVAIHVSPNGHWVRVEVTDRGSGRPVVRAVCPEDLSGRGLGIVKNLADDWGVFIDPEKSAKTVWYSMRLVGPHLSAPIQPALEDQPSPFSPAIATLESSDGAIFPEHKWPEHDVRQFLDAISEGVVATDAKGIILYANLAVEELFGWRPPDLIGRSVLDLVPHSLNGSFTANFEEFAQTQIHQIVGHRLDTVMARPDGSEVNAELTISLVDDIDTGRIIVGLVRLMDHRQLARWSGLTTELLELLAHAPIGDPPAERLLSTLGTRLGWDVSTLWALSGFNSLVCRHVWTRDPSRTLAFVEEKARDPRSGSEGMPRWVFEHGDPLWVPNLADDPTFTTEAAASDGLRSAYAFPVRYHGVCVGVVKMLSLDVRERDPGLVELMDAIGDQLGELLHASAQASEREELVTELRAARRSHEFLLGATRVLSETADYQQMVKRLAEVAVPVLADLCLIDLRDEGGQLRRMAAWHSDPSKRDMVKRLRDDYPPMMDSGDPTLEVMRTGLSMWSTEVPDDLLRSISQDEAHFRLLKLVEFNSYMAVPLRASSKQVLGTVTLVSAGSGRRFSEKDLGLAEQLAEQVGSVVSRARAYDRERRISHQLQRSLLPDAIANVDGWDIAARYRPAAQGVEVGGDWYDVIQVSDTLVALVVGDVEGHDLGAAKVMSRLRHTLGAFISEESTAPGVALERLNKLTLKQPTSDDRLATILVAVLDTSSGLVRLASAGHPPPYACTPTGVRQLAVSPGPPLGAFAGLYEQTTFSLKGSGLMMFTDGLVERRGSGIDEGMERLARLATTTSAASAAHLCDFLIDGMDDGADGQDDTVILVAQSVS